MSIPLTITLTYVFLLILSFFFSVFQTFPWILNNFCFTNIFVKNPPIFYQYFQYIHKIQISIYPCLPIFQTMLSSTKAHVVLPTYEELWALQEIDWIYVLKMINLGLLWLDKAICLSFFYKIKNLLSYHLCLVWASHLDL